MDGAGVALAIEQAADLGGQERVVEALLRRYPAATATAPRFAPSGLPTDSPPWWEERVRLVGPPHGRRRGYLAPVYARQMASERIEGAPRVVLSLAHGGWSLAVQIPPAARCVCYSSGLSTWLYDHTSWALEDEPLAARALMPMALPALRAFDRRLMRRPDRLIANSHYSAAGLAGVYERSAEVVHPPVLTDFYTPGEGPREHFLVVARMVGQKRVNLVVEAFRGLRAELVVAGGGPALERLSRSAPPNVRFVGRADDPALRGLYRASRGLICPSVETFGIVMAEALSSGVPVIAPSAGGALEIVRNGETGLLLEHVDSDSIADAVLELERRSFDPALCRASVQCFSEAAFGERIDEILSTELAAAGGDGQLTRAMAC